MWSIWRIGASQYGVRQVSSRAVINLRCALVKSRAVESIATRSPVFGAV
ncbi:hypothetical protein IWX64_001721 [Arthrobacter sp. CAN_A212]